MTEPLPIKKTGWTKWFSVKRKHTHECCDCSLTHDVEYRISPWGDIEERWKRNPHATKRNRRNKLN